LGTPNPTKRYYKITWIPLDSLKPYYLRGKRASSLVVIQEEIAHWERKKLRNSSSRGASEYWGLLSEKAEGCILFMF